MKKNYQYGISSVFIWSTLAAVSKILLTELPNLETLSISSLLAFLFLLLINIKNGKIKELKKYKSEDYTIIAGLGVLGLFLYSALYYYGLMQLTSQEACILNYLWPIMLVIFSSIILKEKMTFIKGIAMICSFIGIIILSADSNRAAEGSISLGIISCIVAAACYGLFSVLNKKVDYDQSIAMMLMWLTTAMASAVVGLSTENWILIKGIQWMGMFWLGFVVNAAAYLWWAMALRGVENTAKIANLAFLTPFLSLMFSAILLGEKIKVRAVIALVFIIGGILFQSVYETIQKNNTRQKKEV